MSQNNRLKRVYWLFFGAFLFACTTVIHARSVSDMLINRGGTRAIVAKFELNEMLGYIIAGLIFTFLINKIAYRQIAIISLILMILGTFTIIMINDYILLQITFLIIGIAYYTYATILIIKILEDIEKYRALIILSLLCASACFVVCFFLEMFLKIPERALLFGILLYILIIIPCRQQDNFIKNHNFISNFSFLMENIELQILTGFVVTYVTFAVLWYYEGFARLKHFPLANIWTTTHYALLTIFCFMTPMVLIFKIINKYLINLILTIILLGSFILLPTYGSNITWNILLLCIIGLTLGAIFICNILILSDKFVGEDYRTALMIYFTMSALGMYSGALSSYVYYAPPNPKNFLFATFAATTIFILYYSWCFCKRKLYK